ncbi:MULTISPECIES: protein translocase subunit SecF [Pseudonocardia]|jgi:preprotein translocase subunit SecF|uniref:Protein-export membrane protein SecF n=1 Tax=Pseudonocardia dioxanivorans (strain ATCC 55486 / DSM 44775 / JCM 13855 / CB1190) TaxID=675635 RepID=F4D096_PSEUX|nr:protein translocase subunit SecF [Pseudonocardia dioxanivorans]AEA25752.1 protein-export membrane protein SecF [Pseudonocardia dioxanivorans CB1190]GJF04220.1 protein-export membrane protein SecF [Pseudonocardia sp. D17]
MAATTTRPGKFSGLYTGTGAFDIVGKRKIWYAFFGALVLVCLVSIIFRGFNLGIDFTGGTQIQFPAAGAQGQITTTQVSQVYEKSVGIPAASVQSAGTGASETIQLRSEPLDVGQTAALKQALFQELQPLGPDGQPSQQVISDSDVSGTWGGQITRQAIIALAVFLVLVTIFLAFYFERSMAIAALVALLHDVVVTAGIYSIVGFEVSPATVIGLLTILGFSLYDTVVVFDKVRENTRGLLGLTRRTYGEAANLALNQTLMRSINTSLIAVLPVLGLLVVGVGLLGVGTLADLALVQLVGIVAGALSSLALATPLLVDLKMRDPRFRKQAERVAARRARAAAAQRGAGTFDDDEPDLVDDETLGRELRRERAVAAAASTPDRNPRRQPQRSGARPTGKSARPSGKRRR